MLSLKIAFRYLVAKKSQTAVNVITLIAISGVTIATMAMMLVLSIFNGFTDLAESQFSSFDPQLEVLPTRTAVIADADALASRVAHIEGVKSAVPTLTERGLLVEGPTQVPVIFKGVPQGYDSISGVEDIIIAGQYAEETTDGYPAIQASVGIANQLDAMPSPDAHMYLYVPRRLGRINPANPSAAFRGNEMVLSGVFRVSNPDVDNDYILVPLPVARDLLDYTTEATAVEVTCDREGIIDKVKETIETELGHSYMVKTRLQQREDSYRMISIEKWVTFMMMVCILAIALFNVVSTISLLAIEKRDNMYTLRAIGAKRGLIRNIFIAEGFLVTMVGGIIGTVLGIVLALVQQHFHIVGLAAESATLTIDYYPVRLEWLDIAVVMGIVTGLAVLVGALGRFVVKSNFTRKQ